MAKRLGRDIAAGLIDHQAWKKNRDPLDLENDHYEFDETLKPWKPGDSPLSIHSVPDMIKYLKHDEKAQIDARVIGVKQGEAKIYRVGKKEFLEQCAVKKRVLKEGIDSFANDTQTGLGGAIGDDFTPLLGGPFTKQLYYTDYLKMHNASFFAYHHDPVARRVVNIVKHFTLGRGFRWDCDDKKWPEAKKALALWDSFVEANDLLAMFDSIALEASTYGEIMPYWLPNNATRITYGIPDKDIPRGTIPRVRLLDPSTIWEIITYPEDITRVLGYQQIFPTQWQMYTRDNVPTTKFIYQQIPASLVQHYKVNCMSNEKRGRSDLFPILSYLKRLRDAVNYRLVGEMKDAAWCMDTTVEGSVADMKAYIASQRKLGTIPSAGSEFVHTAKVKREYRGNSSSGAPNSPTFDWCFSMICMGSGIPYDYFGLHTGTKGGTRGTAVVQSEPVQKLFEDRQNFYERILQGMSQKLFKDAGIKARLEFNFPEIITQDRSAKLKDLALAESQGWITTEQAAPLAAKELGIEDFVYEAAEADDGQASGAADDDGAPLSSNGAMSGDERNKVKKTGTGKA